LGDEDVHPVLIYGSNAQPNIGSQPELNLYLDQRHQMVKSDLKLPGFSYYIKLHYEHGLAKAYPSHT
jgi:hypothetical protein